jgi:hypothetical protein
MTITTARMDRAEDNILFPVILKKKLKSGFKRNTSTTLIITGNRKSLLR